MTKIQLLYEFRGNLQDNEGQFSDFTLTLKAKEMCGWIVTQTKHNYWVRIKEAKPITRKV